MRSGVLLDEDSPDRLLARYQCESMEDVFLKLSVRQHRQLQKDEGSNDIPLVNTVLMATELPDDDEMPPAADTVVDDPNLLKSEVTVLKNHSNVMACLWKMAVFTWRNLP